MEALYTVKEACKQLRVTRNTIYYWMRDGKLGYVIVGGQRRIRESDIQAFIRLPDKTELKQVL